MYYWLLIWSTRGLSDATFWNWYTLLAATVCVWARRVLSGWAPWNACIVCGYLHIQTRPRCVPAASQKQDTFLAKRRVKWLQPCESEGHKFQLVAYFKRLAPQTGFVIAQLVCCTSRPNSWNYDNGAWNFVCIFTRAKVVSALYGIARVPNGHGYIMFSLFQNKPLSFLNLDTCIAQCVYPTNWR